MNSPAPNQKLPTWIFIATDLALIAAAAVIAVRASHPLSHNAMLGIVACVALGAIVGLVPLVAAYERQKNNALDERQRALEALARTVGSAAEQISIAAGGLHEIAEIAQKNLRTAEHLPQKLQEKIADFQAQLGAATDAEREELERELLALRTTESERLETVSQRIAKSAAEWSRLEAATNQHLTAANEAVAKLAFGTAGAIGKAQAAAEQALGQARIEAARALGDAAGSAAGTIAAAKTAALAELDARLAAAADGIVDRVTRELAARLGPSAPAAFSAPAASSAPAAEPAAADAPGFASAAPVVPFAAVVADDLGDTAPLAQPPKRPRKTRREDAPAAAAESPPSPAASIPEITPIAPATAVPFNHHAAVTNGAPPAPPPAPEPPAAAAPAPAGEPGRAPRKRAPTKPDDEPQLGFAMDDTSDTPASPVGERVLSSDGATRLLVTAYIGIGNRLFIRGEGPGLSWEKGVPLQFVSIGKWRWETNDASGPIQFKLYKNDDLECSALGARSLDPGHQQEVTAAF